MKGQEFAQTEPLRVLVSRTEPIAVAIQHCHRNSKEGGTCGSGPYS